MKERNVPDELDELRSELNDVVRECGFSEEASDCLLRMIAAGELDVAFETIGDNMSEYESQQFPVDLRERLVTIRQRLDRIPSKYR